MTRHLNNSIKPVLYSSDKEAYLKQLQRNLVKKHNQLTKQEIPEDMELFKNVEATKIIDRDYSIPIMFDSTRKFNCIGNKLSFKVGDISETQQAVLQTAFDAGFGERNAFGMGFMVMKR